MVDKYSLTTIEKTEQKYKTAVATVNQIVVSGSLDDINTLNDKTVLGTSELNFVDMLEVQKQSENIKEKLQQATTKDQEKEIIQSEMSKLLENKNMVSDIPDLTSLTQEQIQKIENLSKTDIVGNKFVNIKEIQEKVGITEAQAKEVVKAIDNYNKLPDDIKDGTHQAMQNLMQTESIEQIEKSKSTTVERVVNLADKIVNFSNIEVSAEGCESIVTVAWHWWGTQTFLNDCAINDVVFAGSVTTAVVGLLAATPCSWACGTIATAIGIYTSWLDHANGKCDGNGAYLNQTYFAWHGVKATWVQYVC